MRCTTFLLMLLLTAAGSSRGEGTAVVRIDPAASVIVLPARAGRQESAAAQELQKHLELVTGRTIAIEPAGGPARGRYPFRVGLVPPDDPQPPAPGETVLAREAERHPGGIGFTNILDRIADSMTLVTFGGEGTTTPWHPNIRRIPIVDPTPAYPMALLWRNTAAKLITDQLIVLLEHFVLVPIDPDAADVGRIGRTVGNGDRVR